MFRYIMLGYLYVFMYVYVCVCMVRQVPTAVLPSVAVPPPPPPPPSLARMMDPPPLQVLRHIHTCMHAYIHTLTHSYSCVLTATGTTIVEVSVAYYHRAKEQSAGCYQGRMYVCMYGYLNTDDLNQI